MQLHRLTQDHPRTAQATGVERTTMSKNMPKTGTGNFFEDFRIGQVIKHATPRTVTVGDVALYNGLFGPRFAVQSSDAFAKAPDRPVPGGQWIRADHR